MSAAVKYVAAETDLSVLFGIEIDHGSDDDISPIPMCGKCHGKGKFISYTGRVVGNCFACNGTGLSATAGVRINDGDCTKCAGTGEWRPGRPCFACNSTGKLTCTDKAISVAAIATAFAAAMTNGIKRPKLRLADFIFSRAPDTGKNAGSIYVKAGDTYLGKVSAGRFQPTRECDGPTTTRVIEVAAAPHTAAKAYGAKTGSCSCCGRDLTNGLSVDLGIGPICRDKFGWG